MMTTTTRVGAPSNRILRRVGLWCLGAGLAGAVQGAIVLAWPPQVPDTRFSYPFHDTGYVIAQLSFFLQHLPLLAGVAALLRLPGVRVSRTATIGICIAVLGLGLLAVTELVAIAAYDAAADSRRADLRRGHVWATRPPDRGRSWCRRPRFAPQPVRPMGLSPAWLPLLIAVLGLYVFVPLTPALSSTFTAGRVAIAGWMLLFAALGYSLARLSANDSLEETP